MRVLGVGAISSCARFTMRGLMGIKTAIVIVRGLDLLPPLQVIQTRLDSDLLNRIICGMLCLWKASQCCFLFVRKSTFNLTHMISTYDLLFNKLVMAL